MEFLPKGFSGIVAISGPQGVGKTTLCKSIVCSVSLDDFYYPDVDRGLPGTHDLNLLKKCLISFKKKKQVTVPVFDKALFKGKGGRTGFRILPTSDILVIEGWMMGFINPKEKIFSSELEEYKPIWEMIDFWIFLKVPCLDWIYEWRWEQEQTTSRETKREMKSKNEIYSFVDKFMPFYKNCDFFRSKNSVNLTVDKNRKKTLQLTL